MHNEFVVEFKDGNRDWVDPVGGVWEDDHILFVETTYGGIYEYDKAYVDKWAVRLYDPETTYDWIEG
ncbi:hypothetical protein D3C85_951960 [compost metagenome]